MHLRLLAVGTRPPAWVETGFEDYRRRLPGTLRLDLIELPPGRRSGANVAAAVEDEGKRLLAQIRPRDFVVALDEHGRNLSTLELAKWLEGRMQDGRDLAFVIGGPDGFAAPLLERADLKLSLSRFTFPHALVRVLLAEQLYRAHTVLAGHPYHRE